MSNVTALPGCEVPTAPPADGLLMEAQHALCRALADGASAFLIVWASGTGEVAYEGVRARGVLLRGLIEELRDLYFAEQQAD
jgi:hypothetical protein